MDDEAFRGELAKIPDALWQDHDSALSILTLLVEDDGLYDIYFDKMLLFPAFISSLLPASFWNNKKTVLKTAEVLIDCIIDYCEFATCGDIKALFDHIPEAMWQDRAFTLSMTDVITQRQCSIDDLECVDDLIPRSLPDDPTAVLYTVLSIINANELNAVAFGKFPEAAWQDREIIFTIVGNLRDVLNGNRFTMYPTFRGSNRDYLADLFGYVSASFKADKGFVLEFLEYDYFSDEFDVLYGWMDKQLWADKEFVMQVLKKDDLALLHVAEALANDEGFKAFVRENVSVSRISRCVPDEKIPQWIKDWNA